MERKKLLSYIEEINKFYKVDESLLKKGVKTKKLEEFIFNFLKNDFLEILDKKAYEIYYYLTWERKYSYLKFFLSNDYIKGDILKEKYCFIEVDTFWKNKIYLKKEIRKIFRKILPKPVDCELQNYGITANFTYKNDYILDDFKEALAYKNNNIKNFYLKLSIKEFSNKSKFARRFLSAVIKSYGKKSVDKNELKKFILKILNNKIDSNIEKILDNNIYPNLIKNIVSSFLPPLKKVLRKLDNRFLDIKNVIGFIRCNDGFEELPLIENDIYFRDFKKNERKVFEPILKGYLFFLAALGVIEITFDDGSDFNSLKGIRITEFGEFVFKEKKFEFKEKKKLKEEITYSEIAPIIKVKNPTADTFAKLKKFAKKEKDYYRLDNEIFLNCNKDCVRKKIDEFRKTFKNPSKKVEEFIKNIENNLDSIKKEYFIVLKIDEKLKDKIIEINEKLGNILIPARDYRILVRNEDFEKLKEALIKEGIFLE